jgi:thiamine biosynthesis lipoprotein
MQWKKFKAMGTEMVITASLSEEQSGFLDEAEKIIADFEKRFSRFLPDSELSRLNNAPAGEIRVSREMSGILKETKKMHLETGGVFDPTIINGLIKIGYDKSFEKIIENSESPDENVEPDTEKITEEFLKRPKMNDLIIFEEKIIKPKNFMIDLGGIGKGYIADLLCAGLFADVANFWLSAGGDLIVKGHDENTKNAIGWKVGVQDPSHPEKEIFFLKTNGRQLGIATSGIHKRKGDKGGFKWHHIIDPRNGLPVENDILAVTAVSSTATRADIFAKTALILGQDEGLKFIDGKEDSMCIMFFKNREIKFSKRASEYL